MNALHYYNPTTTSPNPEPAPAELHAMQGIRQHQPDLHELSAHVGGQPNPYVRQ